MSTSESAAHVANENAAEVQTSSEKDLPENAVNEDAANLATKQTEGTSNSVEIRCIHCGMIGDLGWQNDSCCNNC